MLSKYTPIKYYNF